MRLCVLYLIGGMSSEGVGDGAGVSIDLSLSFFNHITNKELVPGRFGVGNFFFPNDESQHDKAIEIIENSLSSEDMEILSHRKVEVNDSVLREMPLNINYRLCNGFFSSSKKY